MAALESYRYSTATNDPFDRDCEDIAIKIYSDDPLDQIFFADKFVSEIKWHEGSKKKGGKTKHKRS